MNLGRAIVAAALLIAGLAGDASGWSSSGSLSNPYYLKDPGETISGAYSSNDHGTHTPVPCGPMTARTLVLPVLGQSNVANTVPGIHVQTQSGGVNLNIFDGGCYATKTPLLGPNSFASNWLQWLSDKMIADGYYDRVILVPFGIGNTSVAQWATDGPPMYLRDRIRVAARRMSDAGLTCTAIIMAIGETDAGILLTSQADYVASMQIVIAAFQEAMPGCPFLVNLETYFPFNQSHASVIRAAQASLVNNTTVFLGADFDSIPVSERHDTLHFDATAGAPHAAALEQAALVSALGLTP